jgi:hypothetical protein
MLSQESAKRFWVPKDFAECRFLHLWNIFKEVNGGLDINQFPTNSSPDLEIEAISKAWSRDVEMLASW